MNKQREISPSDDEWIPPQETPKSRKKVVRTRSWQIRNIFGAAAFMDLNSDDDDDEWSFSKKTVKNSNIVGSLDDQSMPNISEHGECTQRQETMPEHQHRFGQKGKHPEISSSDDEWIPPKETPKVVRIRSWEKLNILGDLEFLNIYADDDGSPEKGAQNESLERQSMANDEWQIDESWVSVNNNTK